EAAACFHELIERNLELTKRRDQPVRSDAGLGLANSRLFPTSNAMPLLVELGKAPSRHVLLEEIPPSVAAGLSVRVEEANAELALRLRIRVPALLRAFLGVGFDHEMIENELNALDVLD